ncbi:hypothetical protein G7054_g1440 [Neopestalotiopsis clavispora]|nr:hypothetical protein G7054_g1440 [Neopestalotiopsis clavispora]
MQIINGLFAALAATTALAVPVTDAGLTTRATAPQWTIVGMKRVCDSADTTCTWSFSINTHVSPVTACTFTVKGKPASQTSGTGANCGVYTVTSGWSGQFGPGNGFTTLSVVDNTQKKIVWPAYTDKQLAGGAVVTPDQSYPVTSL